MFLLNYLPIHTNYVDIITINNHSNHVNKIHTSTLHERESKGALAFGIQKYKESTCNTNQIIIVFSFNPKDNDIGRLSKSR